MEVVGGHERQGVGHLDLQRSRLLVLVVGLTERTHPGYCRQSHVITAIIQRLHSRQLHGLYLGYVLCRLVARGGSQHSCNESHPGTNLQAFQRHLRLTLLHEIPAADAYTEDTADDPG